MKFHGRTLPESLKALGLERTHSDAAFLEAETPYEAWHLAQFEPELGRIFANEETGSVIFAAHFKRVVN